jgi:hypothetical protein
VYSSVSGSVAGLTYAHNRGGLYSRARAIPTDPGTTRQQVMRNAMGTASSRYSTVLTQAQRDAWETYGDNSPKLDTLGDPRPMTGISAYNRGNTLRQLIGEAFIDAGPVTFGFPTYTPFSLTSVDTSSGLTMAFTNTDTWANTDDAFALLFQGRPVAPGINYFDGPWRFADTIDGNATTAPTSPKTITVANLPYAIAAGQASFWRVRILDDEGRVSTDQILRAIVGTG